MHAPGCSTDAPLSPSQTDISQPGANSGAANAVSSANAAQTAALHMGDPVGSEPVIAAANVEFLGLIGQVDLENSTIQFWNQDDNFAVVLGHVTDQTELLDGDGNPVTLEDFTICFSADVVGNSIAEGEIDLVSVTMVPF